MNLLTEKDIKESLLDTQGKVLMGSMVWNSIVAKVLKNKSVTCKVCGQKLEGKLLDKIMHFNNHWESGLWMNKDDMLGYLVNETM